MNRSVLNKRLPSLVGMLFLALSIGTITWLSKNVITFGSRAALNTAPEQVQVSNITDTSVTISYITEDKVTGSVTFGEDNTLGRIAFDDRDQATGALPHRLHHITLKQLKPKTTYYYTIISGTDTFLHDKEPYTVTTAPLVTTKPSNQAPLAGKITLDDGNTPLETIVYVQSDSSQLISTLANIDGTYLLPLNTIKQKDLTTAMTLTEDTPLRVSVISPTGQSTISVLAGQTNPVPQIILSKNYNFADTAAEPTQQASASAHTFADLPEATAAPVKSPIILNPANDQKFKDQQPLFTGKGLPDTDVEIVIHSQQAITTTVTTDSSGNWQFRPDAPLEPGVHTITIKSVDINGVIKSITSQFTVYAQGSQFTQPSVFPPSPTTAPTIAPTTAPTTAPLPTATTAPTAAPSVTPTPVILPTATIAPSPIITPSVIITQPPVPKTGSMSLVLGIIGTGAVVGAGILILVISVL